MGLLVMILGLVLFLGVHTLTTQREMRARLIASSGEGGYKIGLRAGVARRPRADRLGLCPLSRRRGGSTSGIRRPR